MERALRVLATSTLLMGVVFTILEVVYGYFFNVWSDFGRELATRPVASMQTKLGETMLFGFAAVACLLTSIAASLASRRP